MDQNSQEIPVFIVVVDVGHSNTGVTNTVTGIEILGQCQSHSQLLYSQIVCIC